MSKKLYIQEYIMLKITSGLWPAGSKVSSENQLAIKMNCSRLTVRTAMQELVYKGILTSVHGKGYIVSDVHNSQKLVSFATTHSIDNVKIKELSISDDVFNLIDTKGSDEDFLSFSKEYFRDKKLIAIQFTVLNRKVIWERNLEGFKESIVKELFRQGVPITKGSVSIKFLNNKVFNHFAKKLSWNHEYPLEFIESDSKNGWVERTIRITSKEDFEFSNVTYSY